MTPEAALRFARLSQAAYEANVDTAALTQCLSHEDLKAWKLRPRTFRFPKFDTNGFFAIDENQQGLLVFSGTRPLSIGNLKADLDVDSVELDWENAALIQKEGKQRNRNEDDIPRVHEGFKGAWRCAKDLVLSNFIEPSLYRGNENSMKTLIVSGHSLGGAIALLSANAIAHRFPELQVSIVTFGAPRVGNASFGSLLLSRVSSACHIVNPSDPITRLPLLDLSAPFDQSFVANPGTSLLISKGHWWISDQDSNQDSRFYFSFSSSSSLLTYSLHSHKLQGGYIELLSVVLNKTPCASYKDFEKECEERRDHARQQNIFGGSLGGSLDRLKAMALGCCLV